MSSSPAPSTDTVRIICLICGDWFHFPSEYATQPHVGSCPDQCCRIEARLPRWHEKVETAFVAICMAEAA